MSSRACTSRRLPFLVLTAALLSGRTGQQHTVLAAPRTTLDPAAEEILDRLRVPEELRETPEAERLVEDEARKPRRPPRDPDEGTAPPTATPPPVGPPAGTDIAHPLRSLSRFLPRLIVHASHARSAHGTAHGRDTQLLVLADFPLGPGAPAPAPAPSVRPVEPAPAATDQRAGSEQRPGRVPSTEAAAPTLGGVPACLADLREAALHAAFGDPLRLPALARRARQSGLLPELRLRVERRLGRNESLDLDEALGIAPLGLDTVDDVRYEVRAIWDLGRLVFAPEELSAQAQAIRLAEARRELASRVNRLFFERRALRVRLRAAPSEELVDDDGWPPAARHALRLAETEAELDSLTGGLSGACL